MSDFVLRGYCKKCEQEVDWDSFEKGYFCAPCGDKNGNYVSKHPSEPEWFLSATQMNIISHSIDFNNWWFEHPELSECYGFEGEIKSIITALETKPFFVSEILRKAGETKHE